MQGGLRNRMEDEYIVLMPLYKNVPEPKDPAWQPPMCPVCHRRCWYNPIADELKGIRIRLRCTECGLKEGAR